VKDVISGVGTAGVNSLAAPGVISEIKTAGVNSLAAPGVISEIKTAGVNSLAAPAPGCAEGVSIEGEISPALVAQKELQVDVGELMCSSVTSVLIKIRRTEFCTPVGVVVGEAEAVVELALSGGVCTDRDLA
jgi:hypothetical protein